MIKDLDFYNTGDMKRTLQEIRDFLKRLIAMINSLGIAFSVCEKVMQMEKEVAPMTGPA